MKKVTKMLLMLLVVGAVSFSMTGCGKKQSGAVKSAASEEKESVQTSPKVSKDSQTVFNETIKHVDLGGTYLNYQCLSQWTAKAKELPPLIRRAALGFGAPEEDAQTIGDAAEILIKVINPQVIKANAESSVQIAPNCYVYKDFTYCDTQTPSFLDFMPKENHAPAWQSLPADTRLAFCIAMPVGPVVSRFLTELKNSSNPQLRVLPKTLDELKAQIPYDVEAIINSIDGDLEILICGNDRESARAKISIPDKDGKISEMLKTLLPPDKNGIAEIKHGDPDFKKLFVVYGQKKVSLVYDEALLNPVPGEATLGSQPQFAAYAKELPSQYCDYLILNVDQKLIDAIVKEIPDVQIQKIVRKYVEPFSFVGVSYVDKNGMGSVIASDFSFPDLLFSLLGKIANAALDISAAEQDIR